MKRCENESTKNARNDSKMANLHRQEISLILSKILWDGVGPWLIGIRWRNRRSIQSTPMLSDFLPASHASPAHRQTTKIGAKSTKYPRQRSRLNAFFTGGLRYGEFPTRGVGSISTRALQPLPPWLSGNTSAPSLRPAWLE